MKGRKKWLAAIIFLGLVAVAVLWHLQRQSLPVLLSDLEDRDPAVRVRALRRVEELISFGECRVEVVHSVPTIGSLLEDESPFVPDVAASTLVRLGFEAAPAVPSLLRVLRYSDNAVTRRKAVQSLRWVGPYNRAVAVTLAEALGDPDSRLRTRAAEALGNCGSFAEPYVSALVTVLEEPVAPESADVQIATAGSLGNLGLAPHVVVPALVRVCSDTPNFRLESEAVQSLGEFGPDALEAVPVLTSECLNPYGGRLIMVTTTPHGDRWTSDVNEQVQYEKLLMIANACRTLARIGPSARDSIPALEQLLETPPWKFKFTREVSGHWVVDSDGGKFIEPILFFRPMTLLALAKIDPERKHQTVEDLRGLLAAERKGRFHAMRLSLTLEALGELGPDAISVTPDLVEFLRQDMNTEHRTNIERAARALGEMGSSSHGAAGALLSLLETGWPVERERAAGALGKIRPTSPDTILALIRTLDSRAESSEVRAEAASALGRIGPVAADAIPSLVRVLQQPEWRLVRLRAVETLGKICTSPHETTVIEVLERIAESQDPAIRAAAKAAIGSARFPASSP